MSTSERPVIKLIKRPQDLALEIATLCGVLLLIGLPVLFYAELPETIPTHFNGKGIADGHGARSTLLMLPIMGTIMSLGLYALNRVPHIFNYPVEITEENAEKHYRNGTSLIRWLNLIIVFSFAYIEWRVIDSASHEQGTLGNYFLPVFLIAIFGVIAVFFWKSRN